MRINVKLVAYKVKKVVDGHLEYKFVYYGET